MALFNRPKNAEEYTGEKDSGEERDGVKESDCDDKCDGENGSDDGD